MQAQIADLLRATYTFTNNEERRKAEEELLELQKQPGFLNDLANIVLGDPSCTHNNYSEDQKLAASAYIFRYAREALIRGSN